MRKIIVVGSSGHALSVIDAIERDGRSTIVGLIDDFAQAGEKRHGYPILGDTQALIDRLGQSEELEVAVAIGENFSRVKYAQRLSAALRDVTYAAVIHPSATIGRDVSIAPGAVVLANAVVGPGTRVHAFAVINTAASVDHQCEVGVGSTVAPGVVTGGNVAIGESAFVGIGATVAHRRTIGAHAFVGAGAVVIADVEERHVVAGVPAKFIRLREIEERML